MKSPKVTVVVAAYNSERSIGRSIETILALDYPEYDVIVVDNNSTDKTPDIIKKYPVTYLLETKAGWPAARNAGIAYSKEEFVANIDADCFPTRDWLKNLMSGFKDEKIGSVVGKTFVEKGRTPAQKYYAASDPFGIEHKFGETEFIPWGGGNNAMNREIFLKTGGYDSDRFTSGADVEFHYKLNKEFGYKTEYEPKAIIYHEARGSVKEFFQVATKYSYNTYLRSQSDEMKETRSYYKLFLTRQLYIMMRHILGMGYRSIKALIGKETWFRVASSYFALTSLSGTIYGYCKGRMQYMIKSPNN